MSPQPIFANHKVVRNFVLITLCSQFAYSVLAMKGVLLPQMLELWNVSKTEFGLLMSLYGFVHIIFYVALSWAQDRFSPRMLIPLAMIAGGATTFFLGKTSDFYTLCILFLLLAVLCDGAFWPAVLSSVRRSTTDENQGKAFGLLEGGRGIIEFLQNSMTLGLYAWLGYSVFGLEVAFMINGVIMIILGVVCWLVLPRDNLLKSAADSDQKLREVAEGMKLTLRMPEIWMAGLSGFFIYFAYTSLPFYITYLTELYTLPVLAISIFGIASTSVGRIGSAFPAGFIANRFFGGSTGAMRAGLFLVFVFGLAMALLPPVQSLVWVAMIGIFPLIFVIFFMRALYFAPYGEMGLPPRFSGAVIACAAFVVYLPSAFAYLVWGYLLDSFPGEQGYRLMFFGLALLGLAGAVSATILHRRTDEGLRERIAARVAELDKKLGLEGEEKSFAEG